MVKPETFQSTPKEETQAEAMMTPEQKAASEERAVYKYQERAPFSDEIGKSFFETGERRQPTEEEIRQMDKDMSDLGRMTAGSGARWSLDGARNISLMRGEYIGVHKDVDISIEAEDLSKLDASLAKAGYGLFAVYPKDAKNPAGQKILERMGAAGLSKTDGNPEVQIMAIDARGKLRETGDLNAIDVHIVKRDAEGHPVGPEGNNLPDKWYEPQLTEYQGHELNISHPAKVAYFKLRQGRPYDLMDLKPLVETGKLTDEDVREVEGAIENDLAARRRKGEQIVREIHERLTPDMDGAQVRKAIEENPYIAARLADTSAPEARKNLEDGIRSIAKDMADPQNRTAEKLQESLFSTFGVPEAEAKQRDKVRQLREWKENDRKIADARRRLESIE